MIEDVVFSLPGAVGRVAYTLRQRDYRTIIRRDVFKDFEGNPTNTVFVGDSLDKVQGAKENGFLTCFVHHAAESHRRKFTGFDMGVKTPKDILKVLRTRVDVREATVDDLDEIVSVAKSAFPTENPKEKLKLSKEFFKDQYVQPKFSALYVAELNGKIVGYVNYNPRMYTGSFELMQIGIRKDLQRHRIGSALILQSRASYIRKMEAKRVDVFAVLLTTTADNEAGHSLYKRLNFRRNGEIRHAYVGLGNLEDGFGFIYDPTRRYEGEYATNKGSRK